MVMCQADRPILPGLRRRAGPDAAPRRLAGRRHRSPAAPGRPARARGRERTRASPLGRRPVGGDIAVVADACRPLEREARAGGDEVLESEHLLAASLQ